MTYAFLFNDLILAETASLPTAARRVDTGEWVLNLSFALGDVQQACGWFEVVAIPRPPDTEVTTSDRVLMLEAGIPVEVWVPRLKTQDEMDADVRAINTATLMGDATTNIETLLATVTALNAVTALTNAEINDNPAAVIKDVTRECKTVARQTIRIARLVTGTTLTADSGI